MAPGAVFGLRGSFFIFIHSFFISPDAGQHLYMPAGGLNQSNPTSTLELEENCSNRFLSSSFARQNGYFTLTHTYGSGFHKDIYRVPL